VFQQIGGHRLEYSRIDPGPRLGAAADAPVLVFLHEGLGSVAMWKDFPENRDEFLTKLDGGKSLKEAEQDLLQLIEEQFGKEQAVLAGNSIYNDRMFIKHWWPTLDLKLHYRMLDVSAWKVFMQGKHGVVFEKESPHRAFEDIQASIAELQHYLDWFKTNDGS